MRPGVDLAAYDAVILDFDGPMCNVFAGYPAAAIAKELRQLLIANGWEPEALPATSDPHQIVRLVHRQRPALAPRVEATLTVAEIAAVTTAIETPGLGNLLARLGTSQTPVAVASNNNAEAIGHWLNEHHYEIEHVVGRDPDDASKMKPAPDVLIQAIGLVGAEPGRSVFVGDAITDAEAATAAGCAFVALANKPRKVELFRGIGCTAVVTSLHQLLAGERAVAPHG